MPAWARKAVIDLVMPRDRWPDFTDFGLALRGADGRLLGKQPLNYASGQLTVELPADAGDEPVEVVLAPGFAEDSESLRWSAELTIRLYAAEPVSLAPAGDPAFTLQPRATFTTGFLLSPAPWPLPEGFVPLLRLAAEVGGITWMRESPSPR
jgi:hypothetical protein